MHAVHKESSTTTKIRAVFDASMKSTSGISLNDILMVGPFSYNFGCTELLLWPTLAKCTGPWSFLVQIEIFTVSCRMTHVTFGVSSSAYIANMSIKQNATDFAHKYPLAARVVEESFYVDDCLTGANSVEEGIQLQDELQNLFSEADFLSRKWNSSNPTVLQAISPELCDAQTALTISDSDEVYTKTLGIAWHSVLDHFRLSVTDQLFPKNLTKCRYQTSQRLMMYSVGLLQA